MKTILSGAILALILLLTACGSSDSDGNQITPSNTVIVERGPILGAIVIDDNNQTATQDDNSTASYTFENPPAYPITAYGGYIDVNRNGIIDAGDVQNTIILQAEDGGVLTLLTSILSADNNDSNSFFLDDLNLNAALTPGEDLNISALSDVMYRYLIENNLASVEDINISEMNQLQDLIELTIQDYITDDLNASQQEIILVLELENQLGNDGADEARDIITFGQENAASIIASLPNMSDEQKAHVIDRILNNHGNGNGNRNDDEDDSDDDSDEEDDDDSSSDNNSTDS